MATLQSNGIVVVLPTGWEGRITNRMPSGAPHSPVGRTTTEASVVHLANFALPATMGDFGSGAVELMRGTDLLVVLFEYGAESVTTPMFAARGLPRLQATDFSPDVLRRLIDGQTGVQRFFTVADRAFCLFVVLGSSNRRPRTVPLVNELLGRVTIT